MTATDNLRARAHKAQLDFYQFLVHPARIREREEFLGALERVFEAAEAVQDGFESPGVPSTRIPPQNYRELEHEVWNSVRNGQTPGGTWSIVTHHMRASGLHCYRTGSELHTELLTA